MRISGQGGWDTEGNVAPDAPKQVELALENIEKALQSVEKSLSWRNVYAIRSYHTNIDESADMCLITGQCGHVSRLQNLVLKACKSKLRWRP